MLKLKAGSKQNSGYLWSAVAAVVVFAVVLFIFRKTLTGKG
jgi:ABC-type polysaccharide/polyol phosphate export permease